MKRHPALAGLSRDHHQTLLVAQMCKTDVPAYKGMPVKLADKIVFLSAYYELELKDHFNKEETILFPAITNQNKKIDDIVDDLIKEHLEISHGINNLSSTENLEVKVNDIGISLEKHIRKEERELFQLVQEHFDKEFLIELEGKMNSE